MSTLLEFRDKAQHILTDIFSDVRVDKDGDFAIPWESTIVWVRSREWTLKNDEKRLLLYIMSLILRDVDPTPDLFEYVATHSDDWVFGHLSVVKDDDTGKCAIFMTHHLLGDYLDTEELRAAILAICFSADELDDQMKERFGGERFFDE
jgi:hypothetical protein